MDEKKLGLPSVIATGVGLIVSTSCLLSLGQGAGELGISFIIPMALACLINICTALSIAELNAIMPNLTGGLAQYTLAGFGPFITIVTMVGGYLVCQLTAGAVECALFGNAINTVFNTPVPSSVYCVLLLIFLMIANLMGVDMFAKVQNVVAYGLIGSLTIMGLIGMFGLGTEEQVTQSLNLAGSVTDTFGLLGMAFFLFIGCEFVIPIAPDVKNATKNIPLGMVLSLVIVMVMQTFVVLGMGNYIEWAELAASASPHITYGQALLGTIGSLWMILVSMFAVVSTVNSCINFLSFMCAGMAKIDLLPSFFMKKNSRGAYYPGILLIGGIMIVVDATGLSNSDSLAFLILVAVVFWMVCYVISNMNVLIFRRKWPKMPRTFKVPFGPVIPVLGMIGGIFMIINIDSDPVTRNQIFQIDGIIFVLLAVYAALWVKFHMKTPLFKPVPIHEVMATENEIYQVLRQREREKIREKKREKHKALSGQMPEG